MKSKTKTNKTTATETTASTAIAAPPAAPAEQAIPTTSGLAPTPSATQAQLSSPQAQALIVTSVANGGNKGTKVDMQTAYVTLCAGLLASYPSGYVFGLASGDERCADLVAEFQQFISAAEETKAALTAYKAAVQKERSVYAQVQPLRAGVKGILVAKYGRSGAQMRSFGWTPLVPKPATPADKAAAAVKAKATRAARGTKGKVAREQIQGNVVGVVVTPVTQTLSAQTTGAPAALASGATASPPVGSALVTK